MYLLIAGKIFWYKFLIFTNLTCTHLRDGVELSF